ncbi:MAG: ATP-binding cassette domain-containing protein [Rhizobiales bacterium]|nr:ATP-binding cassette domain-containing protein [Hyphomicrobiales bacterium]
MSVLTVDELVQHFPIAGSKSVVRAVNGVSFSLDKGETLALVGESGSGKTTIGRCVLGLIEPTDGRIEYNGMALGGSRTIRSPELRGKLQLVFQEPAESLNPRMRVFEQIDEPLRALKVARADREKKVRQAARRVGLAEALLERYPAEISMGLQQRVGVARAMISDPEIVVLDEPTSALDPTARAEIIDLLIRIQREQGTAYLFISHDLSAVRHISHRIAVLYLGKIVEQGPSAKLFAQPSHPYSVALLSSVLLPNPRIRAGGRIRLAGEIPSPINLPPACYLAGRCPMVIDPCREKMPPVETVGEHHSVRCYRHAEVAALDKDFDSFGRFQAEADRILGAGIPASGTV